MAAIFSDLFQNPIKSTTDMIEQSKLFTTAELTQIKRIVLKNKSGEYIFERKENNQVSPWHMLSPREITANSQYFDKLFKALTTIKVKKLFPDVKINNSNFSIDKPTATLNLQDQSGKMIDIQVGLMNTIDNSTYVKIVGRKGIYHVEAPEISLEKATILDLVESQIFSINLNTILALKITHNKTATLEIKNLAGTWNDHDNHPLSSQKIDEYFQELSTLKSAYILDKQTEAQKKQIASLVKNAEYIVSIEDNQTNITEYRISGIIKNLSDIDLKNEECFVVTISKNTTAYVVKKEFHDLFKRNITTLATEIQKI
jgi:hypothetical protein